MKKKNKAKQAEKRKLIEQRKKAERIKRIDEILTSNPIVKFDRVTRKVSGGTYLVREFGDKYIRFIKYKTSIRAINHFQEKGIDLLESIKQKELKVDFCNFVEDVYNTYLIVILDENNKEALFFFGNIKIKENRSPYKIKIFKNKSGYWCFNTYQIKKFPMRYRDLMKKRSYTKNGKEKTTTTYHRLIAAGNYDITKKDIHHKDENNKNNFINNLVPLNPYFHGEIVHIENKLKTKKISFTNIRRKQAATVYTLKRNKTRSKRFHEIKKICILRYIDKMKVDDIVEEVNKGKTGSNIRKKRTIQNIIYKHSEFEEFYLTYIKY